MSCSGCGADVGNGAIDQCDVHTHLNRDSGDVEVTYWCNRCAYVMVRAAGNG